MLSGYIFATKACIDNLTENLLNVNIYSICPDSILNFGLLTAEIRPVVWGTRANFNWFRVLAALLHGTGSGRQPNCGVEQRAPPITGRAAITMGIDPHSSYGRRME